MDRLVLGSGAVGTSLLERLDARDGSLVVLLGDDQQAASLREEGIDARIVDPTDPTAVRAVAGPVGSVVAFPAAPGRAPALTETARRPTRRRSSWRVSAPRPSTPTAVSPPSTPTASST